MRDISRIGTANVVTESNDIQCCLVRVLQFQESGASIYSISSSVDILYTVRLLAWKHIKYLYSCF